MYYPIFSLDLMRCFRKQLARRLLAQYVLRAISSVQLVCRIRLSEPKLRAILDKYSYIEIRVSDGVNLLDAYGEPDFRDILFKIARKAIDVNRLADRTCHFCCRLQPLVLN